MTYGKLVLAVAALSFAFAGPADAGHKRKYIRHGVSYAYVAVSPYWTGTPRPPWAQPWECFTDEGYGRYRSCSAGRR